MFDHARSAFPEGQLQIRTWPGGHRFSQSMRETAYGEVRFRTAEGTELEPAIEKVRAIVEAHPRVLADPAPSVLLDRSAAENALEIVVAFSTAEDGQGHQLVRSGGHSLSARRRGHLANLGGAINRASLATREPNEPQFSVHRLVQDVTLASG